MTPNLAVAETRTTPAVSPSVTWPRLTLSLSDLRVASPFGHRQTGIGDGDPVPLVRIQPQYPRRAALAGVEGEVTVEFTVTNRGEVIDPVVIHARPPRLFDQAALRAIVKWKFKPSMVDGQAVERRVSQTLTFQLEGD